MAGLRKDIPADEVGLEAGSSRISRSGTSASMCISQLSRADARIGSYLESILKCQILQYFCVWASDRPSFKVKIQKGALHDALVAGRSAGCLMDVWC